MSSREDILQAIRRNTHKQYEMPDLSNVEKEAITYADPVNTFCEIMPQVGGRAIVLKENENLDGIIKRLYPNAKRIASVAKTEESGSLVASMIIMIGTLLSGALLEVKHNSVSGLLSMLFPQTHIMNFIGSLEQGETVQYLAMPVIILLSLVCMVIGIGALKRRVTQK